MHSKFSYLTGLFLILISLFSSCNDKLEINAEWKDITVVYGILNQNDSIHYLKINNSFLGDYSAYDMAKVSDSIQYKQLEVALYKVKIANGHNDTVKKIVFNDTILPKNAGIFATDNNVIYYSTERLLNNNESSEDYRFDLSVYVPKYDKTVSASTYLLSKFPVDVPNTNPQVTVNLMARGDFPMKWRTTKNAKLYQVTIRFHWTEITTSGDTLSKYLDFVQPYVRSQTITGNESMSQLLSGKSFLSFLGSEIPVSDTIVKRIAWEKALDFNFIVANDDMNTYIQVSQPSMGISQERPMYSNIVNGVGIFASRFNQSVLGKKLHQETLDSLSDSHYTRQLRFLNNRETGEYWLQHPMK